MRFPGTAVFIWFQRYARFPLQMRANNPHRTFHSKSPPLSVLRRLNKRLHANHQLKISEEIRENLEPFDLVGGLSSVIHIQRETSFFLSSFEKWKVNELQILRTETAVLQEQKVIGVSQSFTRITATNTELILSRCTKFCISTPYITLNIQSKTDSKLDKAFISLKNQNRQNYYVLKSLIDTLTLSKFWRVSTYSKLIRWYLTSSVRRSFLRICWVLTSPKDSLIGISRVRISHNQLWR